MSTISLASYTLRVKNKTDAKSVDLSRLNGTRDMLDICWQFLEDRYEEPSHDSSSRKLIRVIKLDREKRSRSLTGLLQTGEYGFASDLLDVESGEVSHKRSSQEAEMIPFYFLFNIPPGVDEGIVILQRFRTSGIRKLLLADFQKYFATQFGEYRVEINPLTPESVLQQYRSDQCRITKARFVRFSLPSDLADLYNNQDHEEEEGYVEYTINAKRNRTLPIWARLNEVLTGKREMNRLLEIESFDYSNVKIEVDLNGTRRTIDLANPKQLRAYYDITDKLSPTEEGHPAYNEVDAIAKDLLAELSHMIRGGADDSQNQRR
jgi:hypothetical protein